MDIYSIIEKWKKPENSWLLDANPYAFYSGETCLVEKFYVDVYLTRRYSNIVFYHW